MTVPPHSVHVRIARLVIDAEALGGMSRARFGDVLEREIARRLSGGGPAPVEPVVAATVARVAAAASVPGGAE